MTEPITVLMAEALYAWLVAAPALSGVPRVAPFAAYSPTVGTAYLDVRPLMSAEPFHPSLEDSGSTLLRGIFQVDAVVPDNDKGQNPGLRLAAAVADRFVLGTILAAGTRKLRITKPPKTAAPLKDAAWIRFPVSIPFLVII